MYILLMNKKISIGIAGAMIISVFLPFAKIAMFSMSLFDALRLGNSPELIALVVLIIAFGVLTFLDKHLFARICSGLILIACLYGAFKLSEAQSGLSQLNLEINMFSLLGIGAYILLLASIAGVIFSKPESE